MSEGTKFSQGQYFAWGSTLYLATAECEVWCGLWKGEADEVAQFEMECDPAIAIKMIEAIGGDQRYLVIGSDCGIDEEDESDEEDEPATTEKGEEDL